MRKRSLYTSFSHFWGREAPNEEALKPGLTPAGQTHTTHNGLSLTVVLALYVQLWLTKPKHRTSLLSSIQLASEHQP